MMLKDDNKVGKMFYIFFMFSSSELIELYVSQPTLRREGDA